MTEMRWSVRGMGWLPDWPDIRDYTPEHASVAPLLAKAIGYTHSDLSVSSLFD